MAETVTVTQLNTRARSILSGNAEVSDIWVAGEISNLKKYASGHYYFTLKDNGSEIRGVLFKNSRGRMDFEPSDNMKVAAFGSIDIYVERGSYQFVVAAMRRSGVGELYLAFEELKKKLNAEGLFDSSRKRPLPKYPKVIGVVTSPSGAVIHDIITTAGRRFPADILLVPAQVQGEGAAESIAAGIGLLNRYGADVIIIGRGGGSIEDLWAFNEEIVARAVAASRIPVVSAVGHETDMTISDMVADVRAPTPTAAAEIVLRDRNEIARQLDTDAARIKRALSSIVEKMRSRYASADSKLSPKRAEEKVSRLFMRIDDLSNRMDSGLKEISGRNRERLIRVSLGADHCGASLIDNRQREMRRFSERLEALNPINVLDRGYCFIADGKGRAVTSAASLSPGTTIEIMMRDGRADAEIKKVERYGE
ncbi:MAG: exodeoxyribonuclease VII large subunit [Candidatus Methanoplasma sp.]|jgi:exodeoxyribonuclease VII large subunit|nr:exodeoxyribonuclease VII large subunit [Candidatus Methanoplasma sp.]